MSTVKSLDVTGVIERVKVFLGVKTDTELSNLLNIKQNTISAWRKRGNLNLEIIIPVCAGVDFNWLLYGTGNMQRGEPEAITDKVLALLNDMDDEQKRDVLRYTEKERLIHELTAKIRAKVA